MTAKRSHSSGRVPTFSHIAFLERLRPSHMRLGLDAVTRLLASCDNPHKAYPSVLVAGTNGKGSVTTYVSSMLRSAGLSVGAFYSPHIFRIHERIHVDGEEISSPELDRILGILRAGPEADFTYFEGLTAAAALHFRDRGVDAAVFEVGLGGRLDATRVVDAVVTVVSGIAKDHTAYLGSTRGRILDEKLGIARGGVPLVASLGDRRLVGRAARRSAELGAPFHDVRREVRSEIVSIEPRRMRLAVKTPLRDYGELETRMIGAAQAANVATAVRAVELFADRFGSKRIAAEAVRAGVRRAFIPGRFQVLEGAPRVVLDVSHNEEGLLAALDALRRLSARRRRAVLVFGVMAHKELGSFPRRAADSFGRIICTALADRKCRPAGELADTFARAAERAGRPDTRVTAARGMAHAIRLMRAAAGPEDTVVICGSHLAVEEAAVHL